MRKLITTLILILSFTTLSAATTCYNIFDSQSVTAGSYVYSTPIKLHNAKSFNVTTNYVVMPSEGTFSVQPFISAGTFTLTYQWSDKIEMPTSDNDWGSETTIATGLTSSSHDCYALSPNGPHAWLRIKASETGGTGSPVITLSLCAD